MTPAEFRQARQSLGLSVAEMAAALGVTPIQVRRLEMAPDLSTARTVTPTMEILVHAYLNGYPLQDWPASKKTG